MAGKLTKNVDHDSFDLLIRCQNFEGLHYLHEFALSKWNYIGLWQEQTNRTVSAFQIGSES